ncbi:MAG: hypothetical protein QXR53_03340 [Candidatus Norongarragalinales archaeon]
MKSQIELSMLTRFAMVFFITSLALIVLLFSNAEQKGLCQTQAELAARQIASSINQVLTSPAEDERKLVPLVAALNVGEKDRSRYVVNITKRPDSKTLVVGVATDSKDCIAFQSVGYGNIDEDNVVFQPSHVPSDGTDSKHIIEERFGFNVFKTLHLTPSNPGDRSSYLIVLRCREKSTFRGKTFLYLQNCNYVFPGSTSVDPDKCLKLDAVSECRFA